MKKITLFLFIILIASLGVKAQVDVTIGTGTETVSNISYPAPYGNYWYGAKHQMIIPASEILAAGGFSSDILAIGFDVATVQGTPLAGFEIKIGTTSQTSISSWESGLTSVFYASTYTESSGWNMHTFSQPFNWDGVSSIIIETCFNNSSYTNNAIVNQSLTSYSSCIDYHADMAGVCASTALPSSYNMRPNIKISLAPAQGVDVGIGDIVEPVSPLTPGLSNVRAVIRNFGADTVTSATIGWSVNGTAQTPYSWTGSLPQQSTDTTILGTFTFPIGVNTISAWTSMPNGVTDSNDFNDTSSVDVITCNPFAGIYTVGGASADFPSLSMAAAALTNCGITGPVTLNVLPGTYNGQVTFGEISGTSPINRVTIQSSTGNASDVTISYNAGAGDNWTFAFDGADYITLQDLTLVAADSSFARVIVIENGAEYNQISNCVIISEPAAFDNSSAAGIFDAATVDNFNIIMNNEIWNGYYGIQSEGTGASGLQMGTIIDGNMIQDYYYYGIYLYYLEAPIINGNFIHNSPYSGYCYGIRSYYVDGPLQYTKNKIVLDGSGYNYPIYMYGNDGSSSDPGLIANNFVAQVNPASSGAYTYVSTCTYQQFYHNTFSVHSTSGASRPMYVTGSANADLEFVNNIFTNYGYGYAFYLGSSSYISGISWMDFNAFYTNGSSLCYASSAYADLAAWQAFSNTDSLSVEADPSFVSSSLLYPTSASVNNIAVPLSIVVDDIDGNPRSMTTPDPGAAEFNPPQNDMAVIGVHSPLLSACGLGQNEVVSVSIYNNGVVNQSGIQMSYSINGGGTFSTPEFVSSVMNPGDTLVFTFNQTADMSTYGIFNCIVAVNAPGDSIQLNDSLMFTVENIQPASSFPYVQDFETFTPGSPGVFMDNWIADPLSGFGWNVNTGSTTSSGTGAAGDHTTGSGVYVYTEASSGSSGNVATLTSKCIDLSSLTAPELRFWYHIWGGDINHFAVDALVGGVWQLDLFTINAQTHTSANDPWLEAIVPLVNYTSADKLRFRVIRGPSYEGDVCIDDIKIQEAPQFEGELIEFTGPFSGCDLGNETVSMLITNKGGDDIEGNMQVSYYIHGATGPVTETIPDTLMPGDTLEYFFSTTVNMVVAADSTFNFTGYIDLFGDPDPSNDTAYWSISSRLTAPDPVVSNTTVPYGGTATLIATATGSNQSFYWYDSLISTSMIGFGDTLQTPPLYSTSVFWVESEWGFPMSASMYGQSNAMNNYVPCYGFYDFGWSKTIYTSDELGFTGTIDTISFYLENVPSPNPYVMPTQKIWLGHTTDLEFSNLTYMDTLLMTKVFEGDISWLGSGEVKIALDQSFVYNGIDNLVMYYENWDGDYLSNEPEFSATSITLNQCVYEYTDMTFPYQAGSYASNKPDMGFYGSLLSNGNGCPSPRIPDTVFVTAPVVTVNAGMDTSICLGDSLQMNINVSGGVTPYTYAWSPAGSLNDPAIMNPTASPITNTTYSVTVTDQNGDSGTDDIIVLVNPGPNVNLSNIPDICINYAPYTLVEGTPAGGVYSGPGVSGGVFDPAVAGAGTHTITYSYTDPATGCSGSETNTVLVDLCIGLDDISNGLGLAVYPNPTSGMVRLSLYSEMSEINLSLMDVTGKLISEENLINADGMMTHELDLTNLPQGVYLIRLMDSDQNTKDVKLIKH